MRIFACLLCLVVSWIALPAAAEDEGVVGNWLLVSMEIDGEPVEDDDEGKRRLVLTGDGKMEAWDGEQLDDRGWYEMKEDGKFVMYGDKNEDGELDEEEKADAFEINWTRNGNELILSAPLEDDAEDSPVMTIKLKRIDE